MVRTGTYKRKGGHGGDRSNNGLSPGFWEQQGGRQAAAAAKAKRTPDDVATAESVARLRADFEPFEDVVVAAAQRESDVPFPDQQGCSTVCALG